MFSATRRTHAYPAVFPGSPNGEPLDLEYVPPMDPDLLEQEAGPESAPEAIEEISLRVFAAIRLRVPDSGLPWLDEMIRESRRMDLR